MPPKTFYRSKKITIKARLLTANKALFYLQFHENKITDDPFYKSLKKQCEEQILLSKIDANLFKAPYDQTGFVFKQDHAECLNENKEICLIEDIFDKDVMMTMSILPYDFIGKKKVSGGNSERQDNEIRLVGVSLKVSSIRAVRDRTL